MSGHHRKVGRKIALVLGIIMTALGAVALYMAYGPLSMDPTPLFDVPLDTTGKDTVVSLRAFHDRQYIIHALQPGVGKDGSFADCKFDRAGKDKLCTQLKNLSWSLAIIDHSGGKPDIWTKVPDGYVLRDGTCWTTLGYFDSEQWHRYTITVRFTGREHPQQPMRLMAVETQPGIGMGAFAMVAIQGMFMLGGTALLLIGLVLILLARPWSLRHLSNQ